MAAAHEDGGAEPEPAPRDAAGEVWQLQKRTYSNGRFVHGVLDAIFDNVEFGIHEVVLDHSHRSNNPHGSKKALKSQASVRALFDSGK